MQNIIMINDSNKELSFQRFYCFVTTMPCSNNLKSQIVYTIYAEILDCVSFFEEFSNAGVIYQVGVYMLCWNL